MLVYFSYTDIKSKRINKKALWITLGLTLLVTFFEFGAWEVVRGSSMGILISMVALLLPGTIGIGDGILFILCGSTLGFEATVAVCVIAFGLAGLIGGGYALLKRESIKLEIAFVPFMFIAYMGVVIYENWL
ncbi:MAG: prepilin peptidase [Lachnospiraceae bacterium]